MDTFAQTFAYENTLDPSAIPWFEPIDYRELPYAPEPTLSSETVTYFRNKQVGWIYYLSAQFPNDPFIDADQSALDAWEHLRSIWDGRTYTGFSVTPDVRIAKHNRGCSGVKYVRQLVSVYGGTWREELRWLGVRGSQEDPHPPVGSEAWCKKQGTPRVIERYFCRYC